jgi:hypothetical protein
VVLVARRAAACDQAAMRRSISCSACSLE